MTKTDILYALGWYVVFIISATFHEAAHAWAAKRGGDPTAYAGGQVSLNPWDHIKHEPIGMVVLPIVTAFFIGWPFGYARTPYDPQWAHAHPRKASLMALAGPVANIILFFVAVAIVRAGLATGMFSQPYAVSLRQIVEPSGSGFVTGLAIFASMLFTMNLILVVLNLIPLPPLDGSGVIAIFLPEDLARAFRRVISNPAFGLVGLLLAWYAFTPLFKYIFIWALNIVYPGSGYG